MYLRAAAQTLPGAPVHGAFHYTKQVLAGDLAVLEFETTVEGKFLNGVDIIRAIRRSASSARMLTSWAAPWKDEVFIATGAAVFHSAHLGKGSEVRINDVVYLKTHLAAGATVPIAWVAVGNPAQVLPPSEHERIWDFPLTVYGFERSDATMEKITRRLSEALGSHASDEMSGRGHR
jgi:hypothetical protein